MRVAVVLSVSFFGAFLACATAPIGSLGGSGVDAPDRTSDSDAAATSTPGSGSTATLTVTLAGPGTVTSAPTGLTCAGTTCTGTFPVGTAVSLAATPTGGATFSAWSGACTGATCTVTLAANAAVTATFAGTDGTWKGTYENKRLSPQTGCLFDNKGNLTLGTTTSDAGAGITLTANMDGLEIRDQDCNLQGDVTGIQTGPNNTATSASGALTGTWTVNAGGFGPPLAFPFKATITGTTMNGTWTCTGCTGQFTLTKQ